MSEYPGLPRTIGEFYKGFLRNGFLELLAEGTVSLPGFLLILLIFPESAGYFILGFISYVLLNSCRASASSRSAQEAVEEEFNSDFQSMNRYEVMGFMLGMFIAWTGVLGAFLLIISIVSSQLAFGQGHPSLALLLAISAPFIDVEMGKKLGISLSGILQVVVAVLLGYVFGLYGVSIDAKALFKGPGIFY